MGTGKTRRWGNSVARAPFALVVALLLIVGNLGIGRATPASASRAHASAGTLVYPLALQTLWPGTLDPSLVTSQTDEQVIQTVYNGLIKQVYNDKTQQFDLVPDLAAAMPTISKNGLVYTFKIRPDAMFSDGTPVTAQDFVYSFSRVIDPKAQSGAEYYMSPIQNADAYNAGKSKTFGAKAVDTHTLQITLAQPASYFLYDMTYPTFFVVKPDLKVGAAVTTTPSLFVGAGPWMLKGGTWAYRTKISLVPNPHFAGSSNFKLKEIDYVFTGTYDTMVAGYRSGQFPMAGLPSADVKIYRGQPDFRDTVVLGDVWYSMNVHIAPFNNKHFRLAVADTINRDVITKGVLNGTEASQTSWYPKGILGYDPTVTSQPGVPHFDLALAKQELAMALKEMGGKIPPISFEYRSEMSDVGREAAEVQNELKAIGINISLHPVPRPTWIKDGNSGKAQFIWTDWYDDYPDPQDFSDYLIRTGAPENWSRYSNPMVDSLFNKGNVATDAGTRAKYYKEAQLQILRDAAVVPVYQFATQDVISAKVHGMELNPSWGNNPQPVANDWTNVSVSS
ncbi:MAG TPA: peptide ABC transporter substrate-binding protein [Chloroflexota bacterium]|nr:peptide ABC transporter substrate-binding protein [Chloroflexota bacterium]